MTYSWNQIQVTIKELHFFGSSFGFLIQTHRLPLTLCQTSQELLSFSFNTYDMKEGINQDFVVQAGSTLKMKYLTV